MKSTKFYKVELENSVYKKLLTQTQLNLKQKDYFNYIFANLVRENQKIPNQSKVKFVNRMDKICMTENFELIKWNFKFQKSLRAYRENVDLKKKIIKFYSKEKSKIIVNFGQFVFKSAPICRLKFGPINLNCE